MSDRPSARPDPSSDVTKGQEEPHYTTYVEEVKQLKRERRHAEAEAVLLRCIEGVEQERRAMGPHWTIAPWYYNQLAIIRRKEKDYFGEVAILERYLDIQEPNWRENGLHHDRLEKARALLKKQKGK